MNAIINPQNPSPYSQGNERKQGFRLNPWLIRLPILCFIGSALTVIVLALFFVAFQIRIRDRIVPGTSVMGVNLSGMSVDEAVAALAGEFAYDREMVFTLRDGERSWQVAADELGVSLDIGATIENALEIGHGADLVQNVTAQTSAWLSGASVSPVLQYDRNIARNRLNQIAAEVNIPPRDAMIRIDGADVRTTSSQNGRSMDIDVALAQLDEAVMRMDAGAEIALVMRETAPDVANVDEAAGRVRKALLGPVTLTASDAHGNPLGPWTVTVDQIAALLHVEKVDSENRYDVSIDVGAFRRYLESLADGLIVIPQNGRFHFNDAIKQLEVIQPAVDGRELDIDETLRRLEEAIFSKVDRTMAMAFTPVLAPYHNQVTAAELGITELISEQTSFFWGSTANRRANIAVSASKFDGVIIAPGETFSFNTLLGEISEENGFVEGKIIFGGRTIAGLGGGVCQVSTTAFRAALESGFPITERNSHGYRVSYYELGGFEPGLDAAIWSPQQDFKFANDTPYHLLIETAFNGADGSLTFRFYSTNPGRRVEIEPAVVQARVPAPPTLFIENPDLAPGQSQQVDYAAEGADVSVTRKIYDSQGNLIKEDRIFTHYLPWQEVIEVAPGDSRLNGGGSQPVGQVG